jgi:hypothetical protein
LICFVISPSEMLLRIRGPCGEHIVNDLTQLHRHALF